MVLNTRVALIALAGIMQATTITAQVKLPSIGEMRPLLYGFALECVDCQPGGRGRGGRGSGSGTPPAVWSYTNYPRVMAVAPGSAAEQAGVKPGDLLLSIDGLSVITEQGARRFANAGKGEEVHLAFERDSKPIQISLVLGSMADGQRGGPRTIANGYITMSGTVKNVLDMKLEVWSDEPIFPHDSSGVMTLRIGDGTLIKLTLKDLTDSTGRAGRGAAKKPDPEKPD